MPIHMADPAIQPMRPAFVARLVGLTEVARRALHGQQLVIDHCPFKVGRESRRLLSRLLLSVERRLGVAPQLNDLYLLEPPDAPSHVSHEHFLIDAELEGARYYLTDRGSARGTLVNGRRIGGDGKGGRLELREQDEIVVGSGESPFVFRFRSS